MTEEKTPNDAGLDAEIEQVRRRMIYLTELLALMEDEVMEGDVGAIKEAGKLLAEIRNWSKLAMETEARFEERERRRDGIAHGYALDLEAARTTIGCRLARLRRCCRDGAFAE